MGTPPAEEAVAKEVPAATLRLEGLEKVPLAGEGNFVWKIPLHGGHAVLKVYYGSRGWPLYLKKTFGNLLTGRSSHMPRTRWRTETECIELWSRHGFRCFRMIPQVTVEGLPREGYMVYEWTPGRHFRDYFRDGKIPIEDRLATWRRWLPEWHRRHRLAVHHLRAVHPPAHRAGLLVAVLRHALHRLPYLRRRLPYLRRARRRHVQRCQHRLLHRRRWGLGRRVASRN